MRNINTISDESIICYCFGMLDAAQTIAIEKQLSSDEVLRNRVSAISEMIEGDPETIHTPESDPVKEKIWVLLQNISLEKQMDMKHLPLINRFSSHHTWYKAVSHLLPDKPTKIFLKLLTETDKVMQILIMSSIDIPEEVHDDMMESFIILEGECECYVGDKIIRLKAGGYLEIPLHEDHNVKVLSERVVAIVQRISLAA